MRSLNMPFEQINAEQLVKRIYNLVSPLDAYTPYEATLTYSSGQSQIFHAYTPQPRTAALETIWLIDGAVQGTGSSLTVNSAVLSPGSHTVTAVMEDPTPMVRNDPEQLLEEKPRWIVVVKESSPPASDGGVGSTPSGSGRVTGAGTPLREGTDLVQVAISNPPRFINLKERFLITDTVQNHREGDHRSVEYVLLSLPRHSTEPWRPTAQRQPHCP
jgi:hypothetical protein